MNYLAHLFLAQPNADSHFGNLLGDFGGNRHVSNLSLPVKQGLDNHYLVDKFTDHHSLVKEAKKVFSPHRKRFAGIALDVLFDHYLIRHWSHFHDYSLQDFKKDSYYLLNQRLDNMPNKMQHVISRMTQDDWFKEYETIEGIGLALDNIAKRIRFSNNFEGSIEDIHRHYDELEEAFLNYFPQLIAHVKKQSLEVAG